MSTPLHAVFASKWSMDILSMILVGALWGCTNPFLRQGSMIDTTTNNKNKNNIQQQKNKGLKGVGNTPTTTVTRSFNLRSYLQSFLRWQVWLPYALNQSGSLVFYMLLANNSNLSMAVPICNALALIFTFWTSWYYLGEEISKPVQTILGTVLILMGVTICVLSRDEEQHQQQQEKNDNIAPDQDAFVGATVIT
jgi:multidrug transporter EmrE-like cation transporter